MEFFKQYRKSENIYNQKLSLIKNVLCDFDSESVDNWKERLGLGAQNRLEVEIGCNSGVWLSKQAANFPKTAFIGIDYKFKALYKAMQKTQKFDNVILLRAHAHRINFIFKNQKVDQWHIYFPDPWPKRCQQKNRLIQADWLNLLIPITSINGSIIIKTDHKEYFDFMLEQISLTKWKVKYSTSDFYLNNRINGIKFNFEELNRMTVFERLFVQQNLPIHYIEMVLN